MLIRYEKLIILKEVVGDSRKFKKDTLYFVDVEDSVKILIVPCPCGCGEVYVISEEDYTFELSSCNKYITVSPWINLINISKCESHFQIHNNKIRWNIESPIFQSELNKVSNKYKKVIK
jgi:hypothetical protein